MGGDGIRRDENREMKLSPWKVGKMGKQNCLLGIGK
jgi:hypothetical protein